MRISLKAGLFAIWLTILLMTVVFYFHLGISFGELVERLRAHIDRSGMWGPVTYIAFYSFRSLIFFPASVLTAIAGLLFGAWLGIGLTIIGENISANISFVVGRYFGAGFLQRLGTLNKIFPRIECQISKNGFMSVLMMRLMYLPFDFVGYSSGVCNIRQQDFALGTFIGTIPGLITFVMLGSAINNLKNGGVAIIIFLLGLILSRYLKKRETIANDLPA